MSFWTDYNCNRYDPDSHDNRIVCDSEYVTEKELSDAKDLIIETTKEYADEYTVDQAKEHAEALQTAFENEFEERAGTFENGIDTRVTAVENAETAHVAEVTETLNGFGTRVTAVEGDVTSLGGRVTNNESDIADIKVFVTPEMFGAVGDGVTDDTEAIQSMLDAVKENAPSFKIANNHFVKDLSGVKFIFKGIYNISEPITIYSIYGLLLDGLHLISNDSFDGDALISFGYDIRSTTISNCIFNANHIANNCLEFTDYTLGIFIKNNTIIKFENKGINATAKGHELVIESCKIYQYEYAEWNDSTLTKSENGIGIYFSEQRADNHITDCIINYCVEYGMYITTGPNIIKGCHIYSCPCYFGNNSIFVSNMYFDNAKVEVMGGSSVRDSMFYIYGNTNAVTLGETSGNKWKYEQSWITGNIFNNVDGINDWETKPIEIVENAYTLKDTQLAMYDNYLYKYAVQVNKPTSGARRTSADYLPQFDTHKITMGNYLIQWGYATSDSAITFPTAYLYNPPLVIVSKNTSDSVIPYANSETLSGFWLGGTNSKKTQWVAIGRSRY